MQQEAQTSENNASSVVHGWPLAHTIHDRRANLIQEAYQIWNAGGTEVHNPNVDPRGGDVCLGVWKRAAKPGTYKLAHRVWNYDTNGNFMGTIKLSETAYSRPQRQQAHWFLHPGFL